MSHAGWYANKLDVAGPRTAGRLQCVSNTFATLAGAVGVPLTARVLAATGGNYNAVFVAQAGVYASAAAVFWWLGKADRLFP